MEVQTEGSARRSEGRLIDAYWDNPKCLNLQRVLEGREPVDVFTFLSEGGYHQDT